MKSRMRAPGQTILLVALVASQVVCPRRATAQGAFLVKDINPGAGSSYPYETVDARGTLYFHADDGENGIELWRSDGTERGTNLVRDIRRGSASSTPVGLRASGGGAFFLADDGVVGQELWVASPARLVRDIREGFDSSYITILTVSGGKLFFGVRDWIGGRDVEQLWVSDGSSAGTVPIVDDLSVNYYVRRTFEGVLYFSEGYGDKLLWRSDGTTGGTRPVRDESPDSTPRFPSDLTPMGSLLYFAGVTPTAGRELWRTDGTSAGTVLVKDINPAPVTGSGTGHSGPEWLTVSSGRLFFVADDAMKGRELWISDGTAAGTKMVADIVPGPGSPGILHLASVNGSVVFQADDGVSGKELWTSDGTASGTSMLKDIHPSGDSKPYNMTALPGGDAVVFSADDGVNGRELWITDGTEEGTLMVQDIAPGPASSGCGVTTADPESDTRYTISGGHLYFTADDGSTGFELWALPLSCVKDGSIADCGGSEAGRQIPNDGDQDGHLDIADAVFLLGFLFGGGPEVSLPCAGGPGGSGNVTLLDANGDDALNISDAVAILGYLFAGGPPPVLGTSCVEIAGCPTVCGS